MTFLVRHSLLLDFMSLLVVIFFSLIIFKIKSRQEIRIPATEQHRKYPDSSSIGDDRTRSSSSHEQSLASPRSPNESFNSPFVQHERQLYSQTAAPQYLVSKSVEQTNSFVKSFNTTTTNTHSSANALKNTGSFYNKSTIVDDINKEFNQKIKDNQIILYPPKDYSAEDQERGNFLHAKVTDFRYSLNEHIVGKEAIRQREQKIISALHEEEQQQNESENEASSDHESDIEQALKILDEAVEGVSLNPVDAHRNLFKFKLDESNTKNSYENLASDAGIKMSKKYSNSSENVFASTNAASSSHRSGGDVFHLGNKSTSIASGLNLPSESSAYFDKGFVKKNPLHIIEEENQHHPSSSNSHAVNHLKYAAKHGEPQAKQAIKTSNTKLKYAKVVEKKKSFNDKSGPNEAKSPSEELAASIGIRNGVYPRLQAYQPQWISSSANQQQQQQQQYTESSCSANMKKNQASFEQNVFYNPLDQHSHRVSSFRAQSSNETTPNEKASFHFNQNNNKLKYSESARNNYSHKEMGKSVQDLSKYNHLNKVNGTFNAVYEDYGGVTEFITENSQFILKPAASSTLASNPNYKNQILVQDPNYISSMNKEKSLVGTYIPVTSVNANRKNLSNYNPLSEFNGQSNYKSNPNLTNNYVYHDVYY